MGNAVITMKTGFNFNVPSLYVSNKGSLMKDTLLKYARIGAIALALTAGGAAASTHAQDATPPPTERMAAVAEDAGGFDDWGVFGLIGLAGLLGLFRKSPQPVVHDAVPTHTGTTTTTEHITDADTDTDVRR